MKIAFIGIAKVAKDSSDIRQRLVYEIAKKLYHQYNMEIIVICDKEYQAHTDMEGVTFIHSNYSQSKNALMFYYDSLQKAIKASDIIYSFGYLGGVFSFLVPSNKKLITNIDRIAYRGHKINKVTTQIFKLFYYLTSKHSDVLLCNSYALEQYLLETYAPKNTKVIEYGAHINHSIKRSDYKSTSLLKHYNLIKNSYHLVIATLKSSNNIDIIIQGYQRSSRQYPLVVVGKLRKTLYCRKLKKIANLSVIFIENISKKEDLDILRANATSYIHGDTLGNDSHRLLESMASQNIILAHDNLFNREFLGEYGLYWRSPNDLNKVLNKVEQNPIRYHHNREHNYKKIITYYNWREIAKRYYKLFKDVAN
ncbi:MAG: glycosyltransferase [Campylobacterales bacterium]|nr:glycosyltransferase [Campylobacterales bacterium]